MTILLTSIVSEETYTFYPDNGDPTVHIRSGRLREWLLANAMHKLTDLHFPPQKLAEIVHLHGLEKSRMKSMTRKEAMEPVIVGMHPRGIHLLIDGGHRRWYWAKRGKHTLRGWAVPFEVWSDWTFDPATTPGIHGEDGSLLAHRRGR